MTRQTPHATPPRSGWGGGLVSLFVVLAVLVAGCSRSPKAVDGTAVRQHQRERPSQDPRTWTVQVLPDGGFEPAFLTIRSGDTVEWLLPTRRDSVASIGDEPGGACTTFRPRADDDLTGPPITYPGGLFALSPDGPGMVATTLDEDPALCTPEDAIAVVGDHLLCETDELYSVMDWTLDHPGVTGVFLRFRWNEVHLGPGEFDWTVVDREIQRAVEAGKPYSISFKAGKHGTPEWIFDPGITGEDAAVERLRFRDAGSEPSCDHPPCCGARMDLGSPADPYYVAYYEQLLLEFAEHVQTRNAWVRSLAYVKPSGLNMYTHEARLPRRCECECDVCNSEVWALDGDYTPEAVLEFYERQLALLADVFPDKAFPFMLIQAGWPEVGGPDDYLTCPVDPEMAPPKSIDQLERILEQGIADHGLQFVVQHNGMDVRPQDRESRLPPCPNEGIHPVEGPFAPADSGCPNRWVLEAAAAGQMTLLQVRNDLVDGPDLDSTLRNLWDNSDAAVLEVYERMLWNGEVAGPVLDPDGSGHTLTDWDALLRARRLEFWPELDLPFPRVHRHTFELDQGRQVVQYVNPARCVGVAEPIGIIEILP